jgi:hypothetical protein
MHVVCERIEKQQNENAADDRKPDHEGYEFHVGINPRETGDRNITRWKAK